MSKAWRRIVAIVLIPCFLLGPEHASALSLSAPGSKGEPAVLYSQQALQCRLRIALMRPRVMQPASLFIQTVASVGLLMGAAAAVNAQSPAPRTGDIFLPSDIALPPGPIGQLQVYIRDTPATTPASFAGREQAMRRLATAQGFEPALNLFLSTPSSITENVGYRLLREWSHPMDVLAVLPVIIADPHFSLEHRADAARLAHHLASLLDPVDAAFMLGLKDSARTLWLEKKWLLLGSDETTHAAYLEEWDNLAILLDRVPEKTIVFVDPRAIVAQMGRGYDAINYRGLLILRPDELNFTLVAHEPVHSLYLSIPEPLRRRFETTQRRSPNDLERFGLHGLPNGRIPEEFLGYLMGLWIYRPDTLWMLADVARSPSMTSAIELAADQVFSYRDAQGQRYIRFYVPPGFPEAPALQGHRYLDVALPSSAEPLTYAQLQTLYVSHWPYPPAPKPMVLPDQAIVRRVLSFLYGKPFVGYVYPGLSLESNLLEHPLRAEFRSSLQALNAQTEAYTMVPPEGAAFEYIATHVDVHRVTPTFMKEWEAFWRSFDPLHPRNAASAFVDSLRAVPADLDELDGSYKRLRPAIEHLRRLLKNGGAYSFVIGALVVMQQALVGASGAQHEILSAGFSPDTSDVLILGFVLVVLWLRSPRTHSTNAASESFGLGRSA